MYLERGVSYIQNYQRMIRQVTKEQVDQAVREFIDPAQLGLVVAGSLSGADGPAAPAAGQPGDS
jgi:predicted Zn-dependent peptidase